MKKVLLLKTSMKKSSELIKNILDQTNERIPFDLKYCDTEFFMLFK